MADPARLTRPRLDLPPTLTAGLALVRHGESTWVAEGRFQGRGDPPLSERGRRQAQAVAAAIAGRPQALALPLPDGAPIAVWHSPLGRARETAAAIVGEATAAGSPVPIRELDGLTEIAQGAWEGLHATEVAARDPHLLERWRTDPLNAEAPGGERLVDAAERVAAALRMIANDLAGGSSAQAPVPSPVLGYGRGLQAPWGVVVAHDGIFRLAALLLLGVAIDHFWSVPFVLCGITVVELSGGRATLRAHNLAGHLAALAEEDATSAAEASGARPGAL